MINESLIETWRGEFGAAPVDAGDIMNNPAVLRAFAEALPWPIDYLNARIIGRRIAPLLGDAVMKLPTPKAQAQRWSLKP